MPLISSACDKPPCWICWVERIRGASGCWCLTWQSNTERWFPCFHGQVLHTGITAMCYMCCCRCKSLAKVRLKITTQEKCNIRCWHSHRKIKQADFINFALVCRPFGSQKTPSNQVERANGLTKTTAAHFTRSPLLSIVIIYQVEHIKSQKARKSLPAPEDTCRKMKRKQSWFRTKASFYACTRGRNTFRCPKWNWSCGLTSVLLIFGFVSLVLIVPPSLACR